MKYKLFLTYGNHSRVKIAEFGSLRTAVDTAVMLHDNSFTPHKLEIIDSDPYKSHVEICFIRFE